MRSSSLPNLCHFGSWRTYIEAEAQKIEMTALIQEERQNLQVYINLGTQLDEEYAKLIEQSENVKRNVNRLTDNLIKTIQKKRNKEVG